MPREMGQPHVEGATVVFVIVLIATLLMLFYGNHLVPPFTNATTTPQAPQQLPLWPPVPPM
jgi:hypothetical protein